MSIVSGARQLYRGETKIDFIGSRKRWYLASAVIIVICLLSFIWRGFNFGVEFEGGTQYQINVSNTSITTKQVEKAFNDEGEKVSEAAQEVGSGSTRQIVVKFPTIAQEKIKVLNPAVAADLKVSEDKLSVNTVSSTWGSDISKKAIEGLIGSSGGWRWRQLSRSCMTCWSRPGSIRSSGSR
jgi:preprotein translocase subunit SecF